MHSIHSMIQRFRETKPTPRKERRKQRQQGHLTELWWVREESPAGKDAGDGLGFTQDSLDEDAAQPSSSTDGREKIWPSGLEPLRVAHNTHSPASPRLAVDEIMSEDIKSFLATGGYRPNRLPKRVPLLLPSESPTAVSGAPAKTSCASYRASYPSSKLVPTSDRHTLDRGFIAPRDKDKRRQKYQRESLALDPPPYTGSAELRGEVAPTPSQQDGCLDRRHGTVPVQEEAPEAIVPSAARVTLELDVVMDQLRNGMGQTQQAGCRDQLIPGGGLPVSLAQIGHDLDAQLLEFTLMAKAREQAADEVDKAEEAGKVARKQGETEGVKDKVLEVGESQGQEEGEDGIFSDVLIAPTRPSLVGVGSPADCNTEGRATNGADVDCRENVSMPGAEYSPVWTGDQDRMALVTEGVLRTERNEDLGAMIEDSPCPGTNIGRLFRRPFEPVGPVIALPSDSQDFPAVVPQSWLYGHATLQQTGQSIGAELEVAMLCMQKRLAKQPIVIGEESEATDVLKQEVVVVKVHGKHEKGSQKDSAVGAEDGNKPAGWLEESLQMLADDMASRTMHETSELDRELGLDFSDELFDGVGERGASAIRARGPPAGVYLNGAMSPSASELDIGAVKRESGPPASTRPYFPRHITYDIPDDSLLSPHRKPQQAVKSTTEAGFQNNFRVEPRTAMTSATNVPLNPPAFIPPTPAPGDDASLRHSPPTPVEHTERHGYVNSFHLARATRSFVRGNKEAREQCRVNGNLQYSRDRVARIGILSRRQQQQIEHDGVDDDTWGPGFAVARARRRLRYFQTSRWRMSTSQERRYNLSHAQISADPHAVQGPPHHSGDRNMLNRLKSMRRTYSLNASP